MKNDQEFIGIFLLLSSLVIALRDSGTDIDSEELMGITGMSAMDMLRYLRDKKILFKYAGIEGRVE